MSDANPFEEKPVEATIAETYNPAQGPPGPVPIPTSLMIISIIGLLFGLFGLLGVCAGGASLAMSETFINVMPDEDTKVAMREMMELQFIPSIIQLGLSLIVSPLLVAACIGCFTRQTWSQGLMKLAMLGCILSSLVGLGIYAWMILYHWDAIKAPNAGQPGGEAITMFSQAFSIGLAVLALGFYIWALIAMGGKTITAFYDRINAVNR